MISVKGMRRALALAMVLAGSSAAFAADDGVWSVSKSSGEVWITTTGTAPAALTQEDNLKPGDTIRTGRNGRVLLVRGEETILIAPNSVVGLPTEKKDGLSTTILQQAGSILLEVEKRNVKHFEVETPYLAAVVKGTQFSVTVKAGNARVDVNHGQVEVADFKSGQIAQVMPGQAATSFVGKAGLSLSGSGTFNPIEQGKPRASTIDRIPVPKGGLQAPNNVDGKSIHALGPVGSGKFANNASPQSSSGPAQPSVIHLSTALGEVRLNVQKATHGLAHEGAAPGSLRNASHESKDTIWSDSKSSTGVTAGNSGNGNSSATGSTSAPGSASPAAAAVVAATSAAAGDSASAANNGNGNGNGHGNGNGNGNGNAFGNGNGNGATGNGKVASGNNGNGNNGNGNGNGNNGAGNGKGNGKH